MHQIIWQIWSNLSFWRNGSQNSCMIARLESKTSEKGQRRLNAYMNVLTHYIGKVQWEIKAVFLKNLKKKTNSRHPLTHSLTTSAKVCSILNRIQRATVFSVKYFATVTLSLLEIERNRCYLSGNLKTQKLRRGSIPKFETRSHIYLIFPKEI